MQPFEVIDAGTGEQCAEFAAVVSPENLAPIILRIGKDDTITQKWQSR